MSFFVLFLYIYLLSFQVKNQIFNNDIKYYIKSPYNYKMLKKIRQIQKIISYKHFNRQIPLRRSIQQTFRVFNFCSDKKNVQELINFNKCRHISSIVNLYCSAQNMSYGQLIQMYQKIAQIKDQISTNRFLTPIIKKVFYINYLECPIQLVVLICQLYPNFYDHSAFDDRVSERLIKRVNIQLKNTEKILQINDVLQIMRFASFEDNQILLQNLNQIILKNINYFKVNEIKKYIQIMRKKQIFRKFEKQIYNLLLENLQNQIQFMHMTSLIYLYVSTKSVSKLTYKTQNVIAHMEERIQQNILDLDHNQIKMLLSFKSPLNIFIKKIFDKIIQNIDEVNNTSDFDKKLNAINLLIQISQFCSLEYLEKEKQKSITNFVMKNLQMHKQILILLANRFFPIEIVNQLNNCIIQNQNKKYLNNISYIYALLQTNQLDPNKIPNIKELIKQIPEKKYDFQQNQKKYMEMALVLKKLSIIRPQDQQISGMNKKYSEKVGQLLKQQDNISHIMNFEISQTLVEHFHTQFSQYYLQHYINKIKNKDHCSINHQFYYFLLVNEYSLINKYSQKYTKNKKLSTLKKFMQRIRLNPRICTNFYGIFFEFCKNQRVLAACQKQIIQIICNIQVHILLSINECIKFLELINKNVKKWKHDQLIMQNLIFSLQNSPQFMFKKCKQYAQFFALAQLNNKLILNEITRNLIFYNRMTKQYAQFLLADQSEKDNKNYLLIISGQEPNWLFFKFDTNTLLLILRSDHLKESQLQGRLKDIINLINKSSYEVIQLLIMNFSMQISLSSSKILNALIKKYTQYIKSPYAKQLKIQSILYSLTKIPFSDTSQYKNMLSEIKSTTLLNYGNTPEYINFLFIKQCLIYQIEIKDYFNQILKQSLKKISKRTSYFTNFNQYCELIFTLEPQQGEKFLQYMLKQLKKPTFAEGILKRNQFIELLLVNLQNKVYMDCVCKILEEQLSYDNKIAPEWFIPYMADKNDCLKKFIEKIEKKDVKYSQHRKDSNEIKMFQYLIQLISFSMINYELIFKDKIKALKINNKYLIVSQKYYHPHLDKKLKEIYYSIFNLNQKEAQLIIFYLNPIRSRYDLIKFILENVKDFKENKAMKNKIKNMIDL